MKIEIRKAKYSDVPSVAGLAKEFFEESEWAKYGLGHDVEDTLTWLLRIMNTDSAELVVAENSKPVGFAIVGFRPWVLKKDDLLAYELLFYLKPEYRKGQTGKRLFLALEEIARERGAVTMEAGATTNIAKGRVGKLLERVGYTASLNGYMKKLGG